MNHSMPKGMDPRIQKDYEEQKSETLQKQHGE
jgi:hypothetical protein